MLSMISATDMASVSWEALTRGISEAFSSDCVDVDHMKKLMASYTSSENDWARFAKFDPHTYTRILVDEGNGKYNLTMLCWGEGHGTCIHSHADSHCLVKVLSGTLKETLFAWPDESAKEIQPMQQTGSAQYCTDEVTYINDSIGLHCVENPSHTNQAVSLQLYWPPITLCKIFEEKTGQAHNCEITFYSKDGEKVLPCN